MFVKTLQSDENALVSPAWSNGDSEDPTWSPDSSKIAFISQATNLVADTNGRTDVFANTVGLNNYTRVSVSDGGLQANGPSWNPIWSPTDNRVAFVSGASNLSPSDSNGTRYDSFVKDEDLTVQLASSDSEGKGSDDYSGIPIHDGWARISWSPDGTRVAFISSSANLVAQDNSVCRNVYIKTLATGAIQRIPATGAAASSDGVCSAPSWSPDAKRIAFTSSATNAVPGDTNGVDDIFVVTLDSGAVERVSVDGSGSQVDGASSAPSWSPDGTQLAFVSAATNLVPGDTNGVDDIFVVTLDSGAVERVSLDGSGSQVDGASSAPSWSPDGTQLAFVSAATNLVSGDTNGVDDVFIKTVALIG